MPGRKEDVEPHRAEIEDLTLNGHNCEQIAAALRAKGLEISAKTISRYRVSWGIRKRAEPKTKGRTFPGRKRYSAGPTKHEQQESRKAEIVSRHERGETAEQIAAALQSQGAELRSGPSTITRLLTTWGLIPYDKARARGKHSAAQVAKRAERGTTTATAPRPRKPRAPKQIAVPSNPAEVVHYPSECAFGPKKRTADATSLPDSNFNIDPTFDTGPLADASDEGGDAFPQTAQQSPPPPVPAPSMNVAAELMSAEMLVDLATSTLAAANKVKELYVARQAGHPLPGTSNVPTDDDIAVAKQKVREAAAVMHDLAVPSFA
ncbi:hypothetical protein CERZMDRAFT_101040 [Cercospora zeae-maydis SCOH1-5]|uniref:Clr5 domain-containing protein n=1 Tax=Cercospora zeae-maydis SCOH1-5 TaxID=717836 RepID=A0A6A6F6G4_9PEZI|nr:hypothetical protein CERZMDRAFT_101040 [Cercospora zeae-maydis SCOH1-5]